MADGTLKVGTITTSAGSGNIAIGSGVTLLSNVPAFEAYLSSASQSISDNTITKIEFNTEDFDTDNTYDNSTNYRFTPNVSGKYFVYARGRGQVGNNTQLKTFEMYVYKNGAVYSRKGVLFDTNYERYASHTLTNVIDMNGTTDYIEIYGRVDANDDAGTEIIGGSDRYTLFGAYKIGA